MNVLNSTKQTFWHGALLLTVAGLLSKILSALYRVPYQNIAGDIGFYIYQQVYPFYGIALALSLYGFPVVISKMISEEKESQRANEQSVITFSICSLLIVGFIIFICLYLFSTNIAIMMGDHQLAMPIQMVSFSFLLLPFIAVFRGDFQGHENMLPTALSQISEQFIRVGTILILAYILVAEGFDLYDVGTGAVFGSLTGGFAAIAVLLLFRKSTNGNVKLKEYINVFTIQNIQAFPFKTLMFSSVAICITGLTLVLLQLVDSFTLYSHLVGSGQNVVEAKVAKGIFDRGQPLLQLGVVLATSLSLSLVPTIAKAMVEQKRALIIKRSRIALKISIVVGAGATLGLISIMKYTNHMLYTDMKGSTVLSVLSLSVLLTSICLTASAILQGLGYISYTAIFVLVGILVKWSLNSWLIPIYETLGAAVATVLAIGVITLLSGSLLYKELRDSSVLETKLFLKTALAGAGMYMIIKGYEWLFFLYIPFQDSRLVSTLFALSSVLVGGLAFLGLIVGLKVFHKEELLEWVVLEKWVKM
jgi:PST family polysaccharide transporter